MTHTNSDRGEHAAVATLEIVAASLGVTLSDCPADAGIGTWLTGLIREFRNTAAPVAVQAQPTIKESLTVEQPVSGAYKLPDGWRLVPCEPTLAMLDSADEAIRDFPRPVSRYETPLAPKIAYYRAMLAAAPVPPAQPEPPGADGLPDSNSLLGCAGVSRIHGGVPSIFGTADIERFAHCVLKHFGQPRPSGNALQIGDRRLIGGQWMTCSDPEIGRWQASGNAEELPSDWKSAVQAAYGHLWRVNNEPGTPNRYSPERAAHEARKLLRDLLTKEERGAAIAAAKEQS